MNACRCLASLALAFVLGCASTPPPTPTPGLLKTLDHIDFAGWKRTADCCQAKGAKIAVAGGGEYAAKAAVEMFRRGGNVVDAAIAAALVLAVERPFSGGLGGGGFLLTYKKDGDEATFFDFRETAPKNARVEQFLDASGKPSEAKTTTGALSVATPGFVQGLWDAHRASGKLPWVILFSPAIRLASNGFPVYRSLAKRIELAKQTIRDEYTVSLLQENGLWLVEGSLFRQKDLAKTLKLLSIRGPDAFYKGKLAQEIVKFVQARGGVLDVDDLADYRTAVREPVRFVWRGHPILTAPLPSAAGLVLPETLALLDAKAVDGAEADPEGYWHALSQATKIAFCDRTLYVGDPAGGPLPAIDETFLSKRRKLYDLSRDVPADRIGQQLAKSDRGGTTHVSLVDANGNAASLTMTINGPWGAGLAVPGTGIFLNNEMDDFAFDTGSQNFYGLVGSARNRMTPGWRPASSMAPTIVLDEGGARFVVGGAGGSRILTGVLQALVSYLAIAPNDLARSIRAPRAHHQWKPDRLEIESPALEKVRPGLEARGHVVGPWEWFARVDAAARSGATVESMFDPRDYGGADAW
jgi:gamma-glutamyltranspeptidase/glutathione hydrolase